uniref:Uncharacterized protein n=1 Tax=Mycena chlorophos TaxID=658473 RepID=A0ABQ0L2M3_MYCCL|nr:predicted protein [Mycena chlorophos]
MKNLESSRDVHRCRSSHWIQTFSDCSPGISVLALSAGFKRKTKCRRRQRAALTALLVATGTPSLGVDVTVSSSHPPPAFHATEKTPRVRHLPAVSDVCGIAKLGWAVVVVKALNAES